MLAERAEQAVEGVGQRDGIGLLLLLPLLGRRR
jgi:hypothetical protein